MRWAGIVLLLLLAGCSGGTSGLALSQPGLDVARAALRGGSPRVALHVTNDLLARQPDNVQALIVQGDALTALGQFDAARLDYTKVLKHDATSVNAHIGLGRLRLPTDPAGAEALFLEALQNDPRNTTALNDLGIARDLLGHHAAAQHAYAKALGVDPNMHAAQVNLALSLAMSGDSDRALKLLQPLASQPDASVKLRHDLAAVLAMGGNEAAATRILSADLTPEQIQQALADYVAARTGKPVPMPPDGAAAPQQAAPSAIAPRPAPPPATPPVHPPRDPQPRSAIDKPAPQVQLAAVSTEPEAMTAWQRLKARMPNLLARRQPMFIKVAQGDQTFWRLRTGGFADVADAETFCAQVRAAGGACVAYGEAKPTLTSRAPLGQGRKAAG